MKILAVSLLLTALVGILFAQVRSSSTPNLFATSQVEAATASSDSVPQLFERGSLNSQTTEKTDPPKPAAKPEGTDEADDSAAEEGEIESLDTDAVWEVSPDASPTPMSSGTTGEFAACIQVIGIYHELQKQYGFTTPDAEVCALGEAENHGPICLGATRGQPCKSSPAGAEGPFQVMPNTAKEAWKGLGRTDTYNPQKLEDNMAVAIRCLETMRRNYGEDRFRAYNGGGAKNKITGVRHYAEPERNEITLAYDKRLRSHIPLFQAVLDGKVDLKSASSSAVVINFSPPIPYGEGWISAIYGEFRPSHPTIPHQGMDMAAVVGTNVLAIVDGTVAFAGEHNATESGRRAGAQIQLTHGNGTVGTLGGSRYFYLDKDKIFVKTGDKVRAGQVIAKLGMTGVKNSGAHLHFESFIWSVGHKLVVCSAPGNWFPTGPFSPNFTSYIGPKAPGAKMAAAKFDRMNGKR